MTAAKAAQHDSSTTWKPLKSVAQPAQQHGRATTMTRYVFRAIAAPRLPAQPQRALGREPDLHGKRDLADLRENLVDERAARPGEEAAVRPRLPQHREAERYAAATT